MTSFGSQQLRIFRRARRDGASIEDAAQAAGIGLGEARLHAADDDKNPPPPEAFELLSTPSTTEAAEEAGMARGRKAREATEQVEEIKKKDFSSAVRAYREDILPAQAKVGEHAQEQSTAYKHIKKNCHIQPTAARQAFRLDQMEEAKRDDWLRGFVGLLRELKIPLEPVDLVDLAEKPDRYARPKPVLATMGIPSDGEETDLGDVGAQIAGEGEEFEASDDELAQQAGRGAARATSVTSIGGIEQPLH